MRETKIVRTIKQKRLEKNLSIDRAAAEIGICYLTLWNLENADYRKLSYKTIEKLAKWLEITPQEVREML